MHALQRQADPRSGDCQTFESSFGAQRRGWSSQVERHGRVIESLGPS